MDIPTDILTVIFSYLPQEDLLNCRSASQQFHSTIHTLFTSPIGYDLGITITPNKAGKCPSDSIRSLVRLVHVAGVWSYEALLAELSTFSPFNNITNIRFLRYVFRQPAQIGDLLSNILPKMPSIRRISLRYCKIDADILRFVAPGLFEREHMTELSLLGNALNDEGGDMLADFISQSPCTRYLESCNLFANELNSRGAAAVCLALSSLSSPLVPVASLKAKPEIPSASPSPLLLEPPVPALLSSDSLAASLSTTSASTCFLRSLNLGRNNLGLEGTSALIRLLNSPVCSKLSSLRLPKCQLAQELLSDFFAAITPLLQRGTLKELDLSQNALQSAGCEYLADALDAAGDDCGLRVLNLASIDAGTEFSRSLMKSLCKLKHITDLNLSDLSGQDTQLLAPLLPLLGPTLRHFAISRGTPDPRRLIALITSFRHLVHLRTLDFSLNLMDDFCTWELSDVLRSLKHFDSIKIYSTDFTESHLFEHLVRKVPHAFGRDRT